MIQALSEEERTLWVKGLNYLVKDTLNAPYLLLVQNWLRREFYDMDGSRDRFVVVIFCNWVLTKLLQGKFEGFKVLSTQN